MSQLKLYQLQAAHLIATAIIHKGKEGRSDMLTAARASKFHSPAGLCPSGMSDLDGYILRYKTKKRSGMKYII